MKNIQNILSVYDNSPSLNGWLSNYKKERLSKLHTLNLPTLRDEDWRYTKVTGLANGGFNKSTSKTKINADYVKNHMVDGFKNLVFINGEYSSDFSDTFSIEGLVIKSLKNLSESDENKIKQIIENTHSVFEENYFRALNEAVLSDGVFISVEKSKAIAEKLNFIFLNKGTEGNNLSIPSNFIHLEESSELAILETHIGEDDEYFSNYSANIFVEKNASLKFYKIQNESKAAYHISHISAALLRDARFETFDFSVGSKLTRNSLEIKLLEEGGHVTLDGLYLTDDGQHIDNHTVVDHLAAHCESSQYYKGTLDGKSKAVFNGRVLVHQDAQKTNAYQLNKNLLLDERAEINTKPQLEIDADDVKCSHGATIGQLNDDEIFYLQTRGLDQEAAEKMLSFAYCEEIILRISDDKIRKVVEDKLLSKIKGH